MKVQAVTIEWLDSCGVPGWAHKHEWNDIQEGLLCKSVGWLLKDTKDAIMIALNHSHGETFGEFMSIPKCAIKKVVKLKVWSDQ